MAIERKMIAEWKGVKFQSFPLVLQKDTKGSRVWIFGGRYFSLTGHWAGVEYEGRYRFHTPHLEPEEIIGTIWDLRKMEERVKIIDSKGERLELEREYFCLSPSQEEKPQWYATFLGGHYKYTLAGLGRDRNYRQSIENNAGVVIAKTSNHCRSKRYGSSAALVLTRKPPER
ncbi:MAG: hypothetical protein ABC596_05880 [Candidatus Methanosuratincola petrocarbonis]